jgi:hypothetical protein
VGKRGAAYPRRHLLFRPRGKFQNSLAPAPSLADQDTNGFPVPIQAIYVWLDRMVFFSEEANEGEDASDMVLRLQVSHFVRDVDDFGGFVEYHGGEEDPFVERFGGLLCTINGEDKKRMPFSKWYSVDSQCKDLVGKMTCLDPRRHITDREALQHPWFSE